jgi:peptidoglycan/xylan/chitin deacetylase (PgdA/CDA1 family)
LTRNLKLAFLYVCRLVGGFRLARALTRKRLRILCYHGFELVDETSFRNKLFIKSGTFEQRLATIRKMGLKVLSLDAAVDQLYGGTLPDAAVVITVDDGFHSFAQVAAPKLARYRFPATVYVTTYHVRHGSPVFNLAVQYLFWKTAATQFDLGKVAPSETGIYDLSVPDQREAATNRCVAIGRALGAEPLRKDFCAALGKALGVPYDEVLASRVLTLMDSADFKAIAQAGIDVELHTHRHTFPADDKAIALREIADNRTALLPFSAGEKRHFCYPSGFWDKRQWAWLDEAGVLSSTTCLPGLNDPATPRHGLRRFLDGENIHQLEFEAAMSGFLELMDMLRGRDRNAEGTAVAPRPLLANSD